MSCPGLKSVLPPTGSEAFLPEMQGGSLRHISPLGFGNGEKRPKKKKTGFFSFNSKNIISIIAGLEPS